jgi:hypothetical protein
MSKRLYTAAVMQLRAKALEELAIIERLLGDPRTTSEEIMAHARELVSNENAITALEGYVGPQYGPPPPAAAPSPPPSEEPPAGTDPLPAAEPPKPVDPEKSPTYHDSAAPAGETYREKLLRRSHERLLEDEAATKAPTPKKEKKKTKKKKND